MTTSITVQKLAPPRLVPASAVLAGLGSLAYTSTVLGGADLTAREAFLLPLGIAGCLLATLGCLGLVLWLPRELEGPGWAVGCTTAALVFVLANAWATATLVVGLAGHVDDSTFDLVGGSWGLTAFMLPKLLLGTVGLIGLAVGGWRAGTLSKGPAVVLGLAGVAFALPPFPPGLLLASLGLVWASHRTVPSRGATS